MTGFNLLFYKLLLKATKTTAGKLLYMHNILQHFSKVLKNFIARIMAIFLLFFGEKKCFNTKLKQQTANIITEMIFTLLSVLLNYIRNKLRFANLSEKIAAE